MVWSENLLFNIVGVLTAILIIIIAFFKWRYTHWSNLGVEYIKPTIPFGNINIFQGVSIGEQVADSYNYFKSKKVIHGGSYFFHAPLYLPVELDLIKKIMQVDFVHFMSHGGYTNERDDPMSINLFSLDGQRWRNLRTKLTSTFTSGKMKNMFPIITHISEELVKVLEEECAKDKTMEIKDILARFTTDVIGNCAFGLDCNSLKDPNTEFRVQGKRLFNLSKLEFLTLILSAIAPSVMRFFRVTLFPKEPTQFFWNAIKETVEYREVNNYRRNDFLQLLIDMKDDEKKESSTTLTFSEIAANAFSFFMAGFESSSTFISFTLLELAVNEDIQDQLRDEIDAVLRENDEFTYEAIFNMRYLDMVVNEALRKYPPLPALPRVCTKDYHVPNTNVIIKNGEGLFIPIRGIHYDPEYYPNPEKFDPTRFKEENKSKRHQFAFIPFGEGPRFCIGNRFALMQTKIAVAAILKNFKLKINSRTEYPVKLDPMNFVTATKGGLWIDFEKIY